MRENENDELEKVVILVFICLYCFNVGDNMTKIDFEIGSSTIDNFLYWINERHQIYINRFEKKLPKPWSNDPIFQQWKFTNVFRQLDKGTIALHKALRHETNIPKVIFNVWWYRLFNRQEHIENLGLLEIDEFEKLEFYMRGKTGYGGKIFTSAHMTTGVLGEEKVETYLRAAKQANENCYKVAKVCAETDSMEKVFEELLKYYMIGRFVAYEIVCDLRFTGVLQPSDYLTWANIGPGAKRGLRRLGLPDTRKEMSSLIKLYNIVRNKSMDHVQKHFLSNRQMSSLATIIIYPPFELREIEHSLCEFDKYERIRLGQGRPKQKYKGY